MRLIDADKLKYKFEINFSKKPEAQAIYQHLIDIVDDCPTVAVNCKDCDGYEAGYSAGLNDAERNTENNTSKWVFQYENYQGDVYMCENCCQEVFFLHNIKPDFDFCPYCGLPMWKGGAE